MFSPRHETPTTFDPFNPCHFCDHSLTDHIKHFQGQGLPVSELNRLLSIVVDVENLFMHVHKEEDPDIKQVYLYFFKVHIFFHIFFEYCKTGEKNVSAMTLLCNVSTMFRKSKIKMFIVKNQELVMKSLFQLNDKKKLYCISPYLVCKRSIFCFQTQNIVTNF